VQTRQVNSIYSSQTKEKKKRLLVASTVCLTISCGTS